jgi:hypothetical protein
LETNFIIFQIKWVVDRMSYLLALDRPAACSKNPHFPTIVSHCGSVVPPRFDQGSGGGDSPQDYEAAAAVAAEAASAVASISLWLADHHPPPRPTWRCPKDKKLLNN